VPVPAPLTRTQVCELVGVSPKSLYLWEKDGRIPAPRRNARGWRTYSASQVDAIRKVLRRPAPRPERRDAEIAGLSARNQLRGTVSALRGEGVLCEVVLRLGDGP